MPIPEQPLAEVFGHLVGDQIEKAVRFRSHRLCPFNNQVPNCTKDKAKDPLGVCSIYHVNEPVMTCPIRFREDWVIADDAASSRQDMVCADIQTVDFNDAPKAVSTDRTICRWRNYQSYGSI